MSEHRINYTYAQIDDENIVIAVSLFCSIPSESHPLYNYLIPIRKYDITLLGQRYIGLDEDSFGVFELIEPDTQEQTENEAD